MQRTATLLFALAFAASAGGALLGSLSDEPRPYLTTVSSAHARSGSSRGPFFWLQWRVSSRAASSRPMTWSSSSKRPPHEEALRLINLERTKRGLSALRIHPVLQALAQGHADDMARRNYYSHYDPDGVGPEDRARASGYLTPPCQNCKASIAFGENIGRGSADPATVVAEWMASPVHRGNILRPDYREVGLAVNGTLWVNVFGKMDAGG